VSGDIPQLQCEVGVSEGHGLATWCERGKAGVWEGEAATDQNVNTQSPNSAHSGDHIAA
jgi:hypothetical protein